MFATGFMVGIVNLACGFSVGIIGSSAALVDVQAKGSFMKMFLVEIFAGALGLYGLIVGIVILQSAW